MIAGRIGSERSLAVTVAVLLGMGVEAPAAGQRWVGEFALGSEVYDVPTGVGSEFGPVLGVRHEWPLPAWLQVSAGLPFTSEGVTWGSTRAGIALARALGPAKIGIDTEAQVYLYRDATLSSTRGGGVGELLPWIDGAAGPLSARLRSGVVSHAGFVNGDDGNRTLHASDLRIAIRTGSSVEAAGELRYLRAPEGEYPYVGASILGSAGKVEGWARVGRWTSAALEGPEWGAGFTVGVGAQTTFFATARQEATEPLFFNSPSRSWLLGITHSFGTPPIELEMATPLRSGGVRIRLPLSASGPTPAVAGDFTGWEPVMMQREGSFWTANFPLTAGVYRYTFLDSDGHSFVPQGAAGVQDDGMGGASLLLIVP